MNDSQGVGGKSLSIRGQEVSWVGDCPWTLGAAFGSESGDFLITSGAPGVASGTTRFESARVASDAVNGAAFDGDFGAFSTRGSFVLVKRGEKDPLDLKILRHRYDGGAHGVAALRGGGFAAPVGPEGLLLAKPTGSRPEFRVFCVQCDPDPFYGYQIALAGLADDGGDVVAVASRSQGLAVLNFDAKGESPQGVFHRYDGEDFVAIHPLDAPSCPRGVAALTSSGKILLIPDVLKSSEAGVLEIPDLDGTPYDLISRRGHLFVLTSRWFATFPSAVDDFVAGRPALGGAQAFFMPTSANGILPAGNLGIYLLDGPGVVEYPIAGLVGASDAAGAMNMQSQPSRLVLVTAPFVKANRDTTEMKFDLHAA